MAHFGPFPFGPWEPDKGPHGRDITIVAQDVLPHPKGWKPKRDREKITTSASLVFGLNNGEINGGFTTYLDTGVPILFMGSRGSGAVNTAKLGYRAADDTAWTDGGSGTTTVSIVSHWEFARFGNLVIAAAGNSTAPKRVTITADVTTTFADLGGTPPRGKWIAVIRDFVVMARVGSANLNRVQWSALGNGEDWTTSATTQADQQDIFDEGDITGLVGGEFGIIFFRRAIYRMSYIGSPIIFQFDKIANGIGAINLGDEGHAAFCRLGEDIYFACERGLAVIRGGVVVQVLSENRTSEWWGDQMPSGSRAKAIVAADPSRRLIAIPHSSGPGTTASSFSQVLWYDVNLDRFSVATGEGITFLFTTEMNPTDYAALTGERVQTLVATSTDRELYTFTGTAGDDVVVETGDFQVFPGKRASITRLRPHIQASVAANMRVNLRTKERADGAAPSSLQTLNAKGEVQIRSGGRFHRVGIEFVTLSGSWSVLLGYEFWAEPDGEG